jgi:hypothetical protein
VRLALVVLAALVLAAQASATRYTRAGLSVEVPSGWTVVQKQLSVCTNPMQRLAFRGRGALVQIVERLGTGDVTGFPARPARFELQGPARWVACCVPGERKDKGWFLSFRDGNRGFHAYVYLGSAGTRRDALAILDSLRVRPRGASR